MICRTKSCTLSLIFNFFLVFLLTWMVLVRQNTLLYTQRAQDNSPVNSSCQPLVALFFITPEWVTSQQSKYCSYATVMMKKQAPAALTAVTRALGKKHVFCTLKKGEAHV